MARPKLGEILMQRGQLDAATLKRALGEQIRFAAQKLKLGQILVDMKACTWAQICQALAEQQGFPYVDLAEANVHEDAVKLVPAEVCEKWKAVAYHRDPGPPEQVDVAFADPADMVAVDAMRLRVGKRVRVHLASPPQIQELVDRVHRGIHNTSLAVEMDDDLLADDGAMSVEHYEAGGLALPDFQSATPDGAATASEGISLDQEFDSVFGRPNTPPPAVSTASAAAGLGDPFAGLGLGGPAPKAAPPPLALVSEGPPVTPRAQVTLFPDKRPKPPPAAARPPPPPTKPTLVLTSDALFGPTPESSMGDKPAELDPVADLAGEVLSGEVLMEEDAEVEAQAAAAAAEDSRALFASSFDAADHPDPMHPAHAPDAAGRALFGSGFEAEGLEEPAPAFGTARTAPSAPAPLAPPEMVEDVELDELMSAPSAAAQPAPPAEPAEADLIDMFEDVPSEPDSGSAPLTAASLEAPHPEVGAGAIPPPPAKPAPPVKVEAPKLELPRVEAKPVTPAKVEPAKVEAKPVTPAKVEPVKVEAKPVTPAKVEPVKVEAKPVTPAKVEPVKVEAKPVTPAKVEAAKLEKTEERPASNRKLEPAKDAGVPPAPEKWAVVSKARADGEADARAPDADLASFADRPLTPEELTVVETIEQLADGAIDESAVKQAKPAHMIAALVRLLIRRGLIQETEFLEELTRK